MDEVQFAIPKSWYSPKLFESEDEALKFKEEHNLPTGVKFSEKLNKYYVDYETTLTPILLKAVDETIIILNLNVQLKIDYSAGRNWYECH